LRQAQEVLRQASRKDTNATAAYRRIEKALADRGGK
jgi:hypothetical protein